MYGSYNLGCRLVKAINGRSFRDFDEAYRLVLSSTEEFTVFEIEKEIQVVVERQQALDTQQEVLKTYNITRDRSQDLAEPDAP